MIDNYLERIKMQNQEIIDIISNLKGRKNYEEKKAFRLGFSSLYDYFEDKLQKKKLAALEKEKEYIKKISYRKPASKKNNKCSCC